MLRKKKKGRPSLLDLQKRFLKQQNPNNAGDRSTRRKRDFDGDGDDNQSEFKKQRVDLTDEKHQKATGAAVQGLPGPTTTLPDKKLLEFILDRIQKKDTHGVFSEPVDPEELPDYHDRIEHPMDFGTVRKKLEGGVYASLEEFERDVFLICSNAIQYNSPDTIYYRQARAMQDMAKKDFDNLRQESDSDNDESQPRVVRRGRPPGKSTKALSTSPPECVLPKTSSDTTLATGADKYSFSNGYNLRRGSGFYKLWSPQGSQNHEVHTTPLFEWENEFPASVVRSVLRSGNKQSTLDDKRRETYKHSLSLRSELPVLASTESEMKQLIAIGLHSEHSYARSLARFAANLGPAVWQIAAKKIACVLPQGIDFGPGWVGENEVLAKLQYSSLNEQKLPIANCDRTLNRSMPMNGTCSSGPSNINGDTISFFDRDHISKTSFNFDAREIIPRPAQHIQHNYIVNQDDNEFGSKGGHSPQLEVAKQAMCSAGFGLDETVFPAQNLGRGSSGGSSYYSTPQIIHSFREGNSSQCFNRLPSENSMSLLSGSESSAAPGLREGSNFSEQGLHLNCQQEFTAPHEVSLGYPAQISSNSSVWNDSQKPDLALQL